MAKLVFRLFLVLCAFLGASRVWASLPIRAAHGAFSPCAGLTLGYGLIAAVLVAGLTWRETR